jgi:hypothetical protein
MHKGSMLYAAAPAKRRRRLTCAAGGDESGMLRKVMWSGLYAGIGAAATMASRRLASTIWRVATGEEPPVKK